MVALGNTTGCKWESMAQNRGVWNSWEEEFVRRGVGSSAA